MAITVTAAESGSQFGGVLLRVYVLTNAAMAATPATATFAGTGNQEATITTTVTGSMVYAAMKTSSTQNLLSETTTTIPDNVSDTANTENLATGYSTSATGTPGPTLIGSSGPSVGGQTAMVEVIPSGGTITTDGSSPAAVSGVTTTSYSVTTASFTPPQPSLLVAIACCDANGSTVLTVSDSSSLTWTEQIKSQAAGGQSGYAGVWTAQIAAAGAPAGNAASTGAAESVGLSTTIHMTIRGS